MFRRIALLIAIASLTACSEWGQLANPGFDGQPVKTILFFAGEQLDGKTLPQNVCPALAGDITGGCQTAWPVDKSLLDWTDPANRVKAVRTITGLGFNTISMSSWGESWLPCTVDCPYVASACCGKTKPDATCPHPVPRCSCGAGRSQSCRIGWYGAANTQLSPAAKNELFEATAGQRILIMPFIESRFEYDWNFRTDFPTSDDPRFQGQLAPGLISQIDDLIRTYLQNPNHPEWRDKWVQVYDQHGEKRFAVAIVQAASSSLGENDDQQFAEAFDSVAKKVYADTREVVGFFIDPIPRNPTSNFTCQGSGPSVSTYDARFRPDPETTGPWLRRQSSILGIHAYSPEGWIDGPPGVGPPTLPCVKLAWKEDFSRRWQATGIPFLQDVTPGYDGSKLFTDPTGLHVWGYDAEWQAALINMTRRYGRKGLVYNSWNGYCEGLSAMQDERRGWDNVGFIQALMATYR